MVKRKNFLLDILSAHIPLKRILLSSTPEHVGAGICPIYCDENYVTLFKIDEWTAREVLSEEIYLWVCALCIETLNELRDLKSEKVKIDKRIEQIESCLKAVVLKNNAMNSRGKYTSKDLSKPTGEHCSVMKNEQEMTQLDFYPKTNNNFSIEEVENCYLPLELTDLENEAVDDPKNKNSKSNKLSQIGRIKINCPICGKIFPNIFLVQSHIRRKVCTKINSALILARKKNYLKTLPHCYNCKMKFNKIEQVKQHLKSKVCIKDKIIQMQSKRQKAFNCGKSCQLFSRKKRLDIQRNLKSFKEINDSKEIENCDEKRSLTGISNDFQKISKFVVKSRYNQHKYRQCKRQLNEKSTENDKVKENELDLQPQSNSQILIKHDFLNNKGNVKNHLKIIRNDLRHPCDICDKEFSSRFGFLRHKKSNICTKQKSKRPSDDKFCKICRKGYLTPEYLRHHLTSEVCEKRKGFNVNCGHCGKTYSNTSSMFLNHLRLGKCTETENSVEDVPAVKVELIAENIEENNIIVREQSDLVEPGPAYVKDEELYSTFQNSNSTRTNFDD